MSGAAGVQVLYFAWLRERVGTEAEHVALPDGPTTVAELVALLRGRSERHSNAFATPATIRCAVNQEFATPDAPVAPGDEVAFFPPVTGG